jgi:hypothetical protein
MNEKCKYYEIYLTGEIVIDPTTKNPILDSEGKLQVKYTRKSNPSAELIAVGLTENKFFQVELVEVNMGAETMSPIGSTRKFRIGPVSIKGRTENIFENKQREIYKAIVQLVTNKEFDVIVPPEAGNPVIKIKDFAIPGEYVEFDCGFTYYLHNRNKQTHIMEKVLQNTYDEKGKLVHLPIPKTVGSIFLYASQLEARDAHINEAKAELKKFEVKPTIAGANEKTDAVTTTQLAETPAEKPIVPPVKPTVVADI